MRLSSQQRKFQRAFTLAEVMIAAIIIAILFVTLFTGISQGFSLSAAARERLRANQIVLERIEGLRLVKWDDLTNTVKVPLTFTVLYAPGSGSAGVQYNGTLTFSSLTGSPLPSYSANMKKVTVTVNWTSGNKTQTHTGATFVSRYGMQNYVYESL